MALAMEGGVTESSSAVDEAPWKAGDTCEAIRFEDGEVPFHAMLCLPQRLT